MTDEKKNHFTFDIEEGCHMVQIDPPDVFLGEEKFIFKGEICENLSLKPTLSTEY